MALNFLEQLVGEWYEYQGYFVRRNVLVGKRAKGGYECELDVVAFHPEKRHLVQLEPSMDAASWRIREQRYRRKFKAGRKYIPAMFKGFDVPSEIEQIAVLAFASKKNHDTVGGGKLVLVPELMADVCRAVGKRRVASHAIPEHMPILRTLQFVSEYRSIITAAWDE